MAIWRKGETAINIIIILICIAFILFTILIVNICLRISYDALDKELDEIDNNSANELEKYLEEALSEKEID